VNNRASGQSKGESPRVALPSGVGEIRRSAACDQPSSEHHPRKSNLWEQLSASKFPWRFPVLHGLFCELRSFYHRIRLLWKRGHTRQLETGYIYQPSQIPEYLELNKRTQARTLGIQKLLSDFPWMSAEDCYPFLLGWDAGEEWCEHLNSVKNDGRSQ
jgi:hypothetical protein